MSAATARIHRAAITLFAERNMSTVTVSELAQAAGVARGTIYSNVRSTSELFEQIATDLGLEMQDRLAATIAAFDDPPTELAFAMRLYLRRAHEDPLWGRFITRFAFSDSGMQRMLAGPPMKSLREGIARQCYTVRPDQLQAAISTVAGSTVSAMFLVIEGHQTWRDAGTSIAEFVLRGLGVPADRAREIATLELPALAPPSS